MDDRLALLIGRVVLEWGRLDQELYGHIGFLQLRLDQFDKIDHRFSHRKKLFRRLVAIAPKNQHLLSVIDRIYVELTPLERKRAQLVHGSAFANFNAPGFTIKDHRETEQFHEKLRNCHTAEEINQLNREYGEIRFDAESLQTLQVEIATIRDRLAYVFAEAMLSERWKGISPTLGC